MKPISLFACACLFVLGACLTACQKQPTYQKIQGQTMGTSYHITFKSADGVKTADIQAAIDARLDEINASMSTYDKNSTISKFNALNAGQSMDIDPDFVQVFTDSQEIYRRSNHAFDPTVYPLVQLWGFGSSMSVDRLKNPPSDDEITLAKNTVGLDKIMLNGNSLSKKSDGVGLDFSAIAKGYGVDVIANVLKSNYHISDFMVEIGGEVATLGVNDKGQPWTLAIDKPVLGSTVSQREIMTTVQLSGQSMATSGNYRNTLTYDGQTYSHTISPTTARPVLNSFASVSVISEKTAIADAWATALSAVPATEAIKMADDNHIIAIFIAKNNVDENASENVGKNNQKALEIIYSQAYTNTFNPSNKSGNHP